MIGIREHIARVERDTETINMLCLEESNTIGWMTGKI